ncbi:ENHANCER OF AG-4 protein 2-like isoform X2 [Macadamia integrifolia]|uniref:ENHANCER OF AG-4 protein 2-like isoform X2 n=1 Tax=Macadamia integrifolia TaxID=60698 RepID=UPI001C4FDE1D|nr:ENHANCER OF AG-4 protein 2-like isoform X2 [Macadamia integrifolia]
MHIAFVAPADIQVFTSEARNKLSARCQGKTVRDFARAVKEICEAFEELQQKNLGPCKDDTDKTALGSSLPMDGVDAEVNGQSQTETIERKESTSNEASGDAGYGLERCSSRRSETDDMDIKPCVSSNTEQRSSQMLSVKKRSELSNNGTDFPKKEVPSVSRQNGPSPLKEISGDKDRDGENIHPDAEESSPSGPVDGESDGSPPLALSVSRKHTGGGRKAKNMVIESKRKQKAAVEVGKKTTSRLPKHNDSDSEGNIGLHDSGVHLQGGGQNKISPCDNIKDLHDDELRSDLDLNNEKKDKSMVKAKKQMRADILEPCDVGNVAIDNTKERGKDEQLFSGDHRKKRTQLGHKMHKLATNEDPHPAKRPKRVVVGEDTTKKSVTKSIRNDSLSPGVVDKSNKPIESKKSSSRVKAESCAASKTETFSVGNNLPSDEAVLPLTKRRRRALEAMTDCATDAAGGKAQKSYDIHKNNVSNSDCDRSPSIQFHSKRRAVCQFDDHNDQEKLKTPVHGELINLSKDVPSQISGSSQNTHHENLNHAQPNVRDGMDKEHLDCAGPGESPSKDGKSSVRLLHDPLSPKLKQNEEKRLRKPMAAQVSHSPDKLESQKSSAKEGKPTLVSPKDGLATSMKQVEHKTIKLQTKASSTTSRKPQVGSAKGSGLGSDCLNHSSNQGTIQRSRPALSAEKAKINLKTNPLMNDTAILEYSTLNDSQLGERSNVIGDDIAASSLTDTKFADSATSLKHLIAAAQAKRKLAYSQSLSHDNPIPTFISTATVVQERSPSPASAVQTFLSGTTHAMQQDAKGFYARLSLASPSPHAHQVASQNQLEHEDPEEGRVSSGQRAPNGSLSGGTEAVVARDAFEGMIETLSRTKESIGRATRLAIDCAKYGIANEVGGTEEYIFHIIFCLFRCLFLHFM